MTVSRIPLVGSEFGLLLVSQRHHDATVAGPVSSWGAAVGGEWVSSLWVGGPAACRACSPVCGPGGLGSYSSLQRVALNCVEFVLVFVSPLPGGVMLLSAPLRFPSFY